MNTSRRVACLIINSNNGKTLIITCARQLWLEGHLDTDQITPEYNTCESFSMINAYDCRLIDKDMRAEMCMHELHCNSGSFCRHILFIISI